MVFILLLLVCSGSCNGLFNTLVCVCVCVCVCFFNFFFSSRVKLHFFRWPTTVNICEMQRTKGNRSKVKKNQSHV